MWGNAVLVAMTRQENHRPTGEMAEVQRRGGLAVGRTHDLPMRDGKPGEPAKTAAADDCQHVNPPRMA